MSFHVPEGYRVTTGRLASRREDGNNGAFRVTVKHARHLFVIASDGLGWEHVSVSHPDWTPSWEDMSEIKGLFWDKQDCVVQFHPPGSEYVDMHGQCLHLWRPTGAQLPRPDPALVGPVLRKRSA